MTFELARESYVRITAFDITGRRVGKLYDGSATAGVHHLDCSAHSPSGGGLQGGVCLIRIEADEKTLVRRVGCGDRCKSFDPIRNGS